MFNWMFFCGAARSTPRLLSCVKKVGKDTPKTSWFLDFQQKGGPPFDPPVMLETFVIDEGERDRLAVTAGAKPPGDI